MQSTGRSMDWTLEDNRVDGLLFCAILRNRTIRPCPFPSAGVETSDRGKECVKPNPFCSWQGHSVSMGADVWDEITESRSVLQPLRFPSVICPERCTFVVVVTIWSDELLCGKCKCVSRFEMPFVCTRWTGEHWVEQMSRLHCTEC